ncbi:MAG: orotidine-5'-phosphate decarboxylase [bacterium]
MTINDKIKTIIKKQNSLVCVGLDIYSERIPAHIMKKNDPVFTFNQKIIDATADIAAAYKPNLAFYEALGTEGWDILKRTVDYIPKGILKIGDAKRGDIGTTAQKYASALFDLGFDMVTVNPYLGFDSVQPFIQDESKGVFILCLTSNPSSGDFQYLTFKKQYLYEIIAKKVNEWNKNNNCGLVVGATHPGELKTIRSLTPELPFLIPGIGAQGGDLKSAVIDGTDDTFSMAVINSSRGILYASQDKNFAQAARQKAKTLQTDINQIIKKHQQKNK